MEFSPRFVFSHTNCSVYGKYLKVCSRHFKQSDYAFAGKVGASSFSTSASNLLNKKWRESKGLPLNPNKEKILLELPDYTFVDGKPTPYGSRQRLRIEKQKEYTAKIIELTEEMNLAERLYQERIAQKKAEADERIASKLKQKGNKVLTT